MEVAQLVEQSSANPRVVDPNDPGVSHFLGTLLTNSIVLLVLGIEGNASLTFQGRLPVVNDLMIL